MNARKLQVPGNEEVHEGFTHEGCDEEKPGQGKGLKKKAFISKETACRRKADVGVNVAAECTSAFPPIYPKVCGTYIYREFQECSELDHVAAYGCCVSVQTSRGSEMGRTEELGLGSS